MRSLHAACLALLVCALAILPLSAHATEEDRPIVLIGTGGVMWDYVDPETTPNLFALSEESAVGNLSVRAVHPVACPADGWLTLGAGERAGDDETDNGACRLLEEPVDGTVPHWEDYVASAENSAYSPRLGQLAELTADRNTLALGPGAAIALAYENGTVSSYGQIEDYRDLAEGQDLVLVDIGSMSQIEPTVFDETQNRQKGDPLAASFETQEWDEEAIRADMATIDARLGEVLDAIEETTPEARIIVASLSDYSATASTQQVIMEVTGEPGLLTSSTTRRSGLVAATDLLPTLVNGSEGPGDSIVADAGGTAEGNRAAVTEFDSLTKAIKPATGWVYALWGISWLLVFFATLIFRRKPVLRGGALAVASLPASAVLMNGTPWHTAGNPTLVLCLGIAVGSVLIGILSYRLHGRHRAAPAALVAGLVLLSYLLPVLVGSPLALNSVFGALPSVGRFYGMNNMMFAIVGASGLVLAGIIAEKLADRQRAAALIVGLGATIVFIDGSPWHGTDFGGPPVLVVGFLFLALLVSGRRLTWLSSLGILLAGVAVAAFFLLVDYLRPVEDRTHLGDFAQSILDGTAFDVIARKAMQVVALWPLLLVFVIMLAVLWMLWRKKAPISLEQLVHPNGDSWVWTIIALVVVLLGGTLLNDSGPIIFLTGGMVAIPLLASILYYGKPLGARKQKLARDTDEKARGSNRDSTTN
ncbi:MAG: hypothetical protein ACTHUY_08375 [Flaviflexus sp.]|uniref:hypothetical protein n=1 Tax=Flaviflexus sp. TaxID=1969482 RepID=UPI003F8E5C45